MSSIERTGCTQLLLVDNDDAVRALMNATLEHKGFDVAGSVHRVGEWRIAVTTVKPSPGSGMCRSVSTSKLSVAIHLRASVTLAAATRLNPNSGGFGLFM